jgi:hypothetical protein
MLLDDAETTLTVPPGARLLPPTRSMAAAIMALSFSILLV